MTKNEFLDVSREYFKSIGFQTLKKSKFYFDSEFISVFIWMQHSNFSDMFYINYYFQIKKFHPEAKSESGVWDTLGGRLVYNSNKGFPVEYLLWDKEEYINTLKKLVQRQLFPIMQYDIKYIKKLAKNCESVDAYILFKQSDREKILSL